MANEKTPLCETRVDINNSDHGGNGDRDGTTCGRIWVRLRMVFINVWQSEQLAEIRQRLTCGCVTAIVSVILYALLVATAVGVVIAFASILLDKSCDERTDSTNSSNFTLDTKQKGLPIIPSDSRDIFSKVSFIIYIVGTILKLPQCIALTFSYIKQRLSSDGNLNVKMEPHAQARYPCSSYVYSVCYLSMFVLVMVIYFALVVSVTVFEGMANTDYTDKCGISCLFAVSLTIGSGILRLLEFIVIFIMLRAAFVVHRIFLELKYITLRKDNDAAIPNVVDNGAVNPNKVHMYIQGQYDSTANKVRPYISPFQSWFFFTWILYAVLTLYGITVILRDVIVFSDKFKFSSAYSTIEDIFLCVDAAYKLLSFIIPYILAISINDWHSEAYNELKKKQLDPELYSVDPEKCARAAELTIAKKDECDFVPRVFTIEIPIGSIQYFIPILFPTVSLIFGFTVHV